MMHSTDELGQAWQDGVIESIIELVKAPDGNFASIGKLHNAVSDPHSLQKVIEFLSSTPQGKQAFQKRPRLGD